MEAMDVFELEYATDAQISPNGERVVYVRHFNDVHDRPPLPEPLGH